MANVVRRYQDLVVWQIADELRTEVHRLVSTEPANRDWKFKDQLRDAASSVPANIAEGYRRFSSRDFARFLQVAYASAGEAENWLDDGCARGCWKDEDLIAARRLLRRLNPPLRALIRYLRSPKAAARSK